ncbi:uncharacterized protein PG998_003739 [Apiospora kogelbergensis]|uniref:Uncharacterized protein n=1 Tax=Apiospora kogelbergensis TaxID=1337665 RepID=A0AAW0QTB9_9PEZI
MVTCRIPVICYTGCGCTVLDESRDPKQHQWPGHVCTKACPAYDIRFVAGLCEGARSKILFNDDLGSECNHAATASTLECEENAPGYDEQAPKEYVRHHQRGCLKV